MAMISWIKKLTYFYAASNPCSADLIDYVVPAKVA